VEGFAFYAYLIAVTLFLVYLFYQSIRQAKHTSNLHIVISLFPRKSLLGKKLPVLFIIVLSINRNTWLLLADNTISSHLNIPPSMNNKNL